MTSLKHVRSIRLTDEQADIVFDLSLQSEWREGQVIQKAIALGLEEMQRPPRVWLRTFDRDAMLAACTEILAETR